MDIQLENGRQTHQMDMVIVSDLIPIALPEGKDAPFLTNSTDLLICEMKNSRGLVQKKEIFFQIFYIAAFIPFLIPLVFCPSHK